jgi:hypothetical protein
MYYLFDKAISKPEDHVSTEAYITHTNYQHCMIIIELVKICLISAFHIYSTWQTSDRKYEIEKQH